tara:strand:- start:119 stop:1540 length:1422 start_codon:yes stop_codon:yes gene_type:complete
MIFIHPFNSKISKQILSIAYPIMLGNLSRALMGIVDMIMVGKLGVYSIAAVGFGEMIVSTIYLGLGVSLMVATQTITSRRYGENHYSKCSESLFNGQLLGLLFGLPFLIFGFIYCQSIIEFFIKDSKTIDECVKYTSIQFLGILFPISTFIYRGFYTGIQKTSIYLKVVFISNIINIYLNLGLIFGRDNLIIYFSNFDIPFVKNIGLLWTFIPFPEMGIRGAALGTVIASFLSFSCFFLYYFSEDIYTKFHLQKFRINFNNMNKHLKLSWPIIKREGTVMLGLTIFLAIIGMLGTIQLAAANILIRIYNISLMPALGIGAACSSIVGYSLGKNNPKNAETSIKEGLKYNLLIMGTFACCFILFTKPILSIFTSDLNLLKVTIPLLKFFAFISILDAIAITLMNALDGSGDVKFTSKITIIYMWIFIIPLTILTGLYLNMNVWGPWLSWLAGFLYLVIMLMIRIYKGDWKTIKI